MGKNLKRLIAGVDSAGFKNELMLYLLRHLLEAKATAPVPYHALIKSSNNTMNKHKFASVHTLHHIGNNKTKCI